jgi:AraC-like DNA-binding protein
MDDRLLTLRMAAWMEKHLTDPDLHLDLEKASGYSENRLRQKFYNITGETPSGYLRKRRLTEAARALIRGERIVDVAAAYGYSSQDNFTTAFGSWFGITPAKLRDLDRNYRNLLMRMKEPLNLMELTNLKQSPLNTTLMSAIKGASEYFDLDWSIAKLFGYSTHAFLINIATNHRGDTPDFGICPSSPYCWNKDRFFLALHNMGIRRVDSIMLNAGFPPGHRRTTPEELSNAERRVKAHLDAGKVCVLDFRDHQLIAGYDPKGFILLQPWQCAPKIVRPALSFGEQNEALNSDGWVGFTLLEKEELRADESTLLQSALTTALRMRSAPEEFTLECYRSGDGAWENWLAGIDKGLGSSHGHWWNGSVWMECRKMAADFFAEIEPAMKNAKAEALCQELAKLYRECAGQLNIARAKDAQAGVQKAALAEGRELDSRCAGLMKELLAETVA